MLSIFLHHIDYASKKMFLATVMLLLCNNMIQNSISVHYLLKKLYTGRNIF